MDNYVLTGPDGRAVNLGSYVRADPGPDFGVRGLLKAAYAENALTDGGVLAAEDTSVRQFSFPLLLASAGSPTLGLFGLENTIRQLARPGGYIDLILDQVATGDAVRFDVLTGRLEDEYNIRHGELDRRMTTLTLDVQPFGYLPTQIVLASAASVGLPGLLTIAAASIVGDVPGLAEITVQPTSATVYGAGTWVSDMVAWSLGARPSFAALFPAAALSSAITGTITADAFAVGSQAVQLMGSPTQAGWTQMAFASISQALEPAYRGRFRAYGWLKLAPSMGLPWQVSLDAVPVAMRGQALASAQTIATIQPAVASGVGFGAHASPAYTLVDLGELSLPPAGSGLGQALSLRLWSNGGGTNVGVATPVLSVGGLYLQPVDGPAGVLPRGLGQPTISSPSVGRLNVDAYTRRALIGTPTGDLATVYPAANALAYYRGGLPLVGASTIQLDLLGAARSVSSGATDPMIRSAPQFATVSVRYRPRFIFAKAV